MIERNDGPQAYPVAENESLPLKGGSEDRENPDQYVISRSPLECVRRK